MEISSAASVVSVTRAAESSVLVAGKVLETQKMEGRAAVSLIREAAFTSGSTAKLIDVYV